MPRPPFKRNKLNAPTRRTQRAPNIPSSPRARQELQTKLANKAVGEKPADSDDSDRLVRRVPNLRNRKNIPRLEIYASGGVARSDEPGSHPSRKRKLSNVQPNQVRKLQPTVKNMEARSAQPKPKSLHGDAPPEMLSPIPAAMTIQSSPLGAARRAPASPTPLTGTPNVGASILGSLKPRRRLPSILQMVDNHDSSSFNVDDEAEFLPDDESTPINLTKGVAITSTPNSSLSLHPQSNSRKRKISPLASSQSEPPPVRQPTASAPKSVIQVAGSSPPDSKLPTLPQLSVKTSNRRDRPTYDDSIMAPPESSSSPEPSPVKKKPLSATKSQRRKAEQPRVLTTEALQAMMPKRPKIRQQRKQPTSEFDIALDSDEASKAQVSPEVGLVEDEQSFIPSGRTKKGKGRAIRKEQPVSKPNNARKKARNDRATSTLSPTKNTRLRNRSTKSPSQQPRAITSASTSATATAIVKPNTYASRRRQDARSGRAADKENRQGGSSADLLEGTGSSGDEASSDVDGDAGKISVGLRALRDKFAEIDEFELEFEEVDISSSDPMMR